MAKYKLRPPGRYDDGCIEPDLSLCASCDRAASCPDRTDDRKDIVKCVIICDHYHNSVKMIGDKTGASCEIVPESECEKPNLCKSCLSAEVCLMYRYIRCRENPVSGLTQCCHYIGDKREADANG